MNISELLQVIPEFNLIKDADLRMKTINAWKAAMEDGRWCVTDLARISFAPDHKDEKIRSVSVVEHTRGVAKMCQAMIDVLKKVYNEKLRINDDYLLAGALLHDIGKIGGYTVKPDGSAAKNSLGSLLTHQNSGAQYARAHGLPLEVQQIIAIHGSIHNQKIAPIVESRIVHYADLMNYEAFLQILG